MKDINLLIEKYIAIKIKTRKLAVYENPTILDLKSLKEDDITDVRFFIDAVNDNLYVWDAEKELHHVVWNNLKLKPTIDEYGYEENYEMIAGYGSIVGNKIYVDDIMYDREYYGELPDLSQYKILKISRDDFY